MDRKYKISVIVPVYRAQAYLERCVDSVLNQTLPDIEVILIDDGSPDRCPEICDEYAEKDGRVMVVHKENAGAMSAWREGVKKSSGDYLHFLDSDDWIAPETLKEMSAALTGQKKEIVCCNFIIEKKKLQSKEKHAIAPGIYEGEELDLQVKAHLLGNECRTVSMSRCMKLFSRKLIEDNLSFCDPRFHLLEDVTIVLPALLDSERVVILEDAYFYHYQFNEESTVHKYNAGMYEEIRAGYDKLCAVYGQKGVGGGKEQVDREYLFLLFLALKNEIRGKEPGVMGRVKKICQDEKSRQTLSYAPDHLSQKANMILYQVLKRPVLPCILFARALFFLYDWRSG